MEMLLKIILRLIYHPLVDNVLSLPQVKAYLAERELLGQGSNAFLFGFEVEFWDPNFFLL